MLELAIVLPVMFILFVMVADLARALNTYRVAGLAAYEVARLSARNPSLLTGVQTFGCPANYTTIYPDDTFNRQACDIITKLGLVCINGNCPSVQTNLYSIPLASSGSRKVIDNDVVVPFKTDMPYGSYIIPYIRATRSGPYLFP